MENHLRMNKKELLKKLYYDLINPTSYAGKYKLLQEAGNHRIMTEEELLKKLYCDLKSQDAYAGRSKLLQKAKKHDASISIEDVEEWLKLQLAYTLDKPIRINFKARQVVAHQIDKQWQIDL